MTSILEKQQAERLQKAVHTLQKKPENKTCFDCGALGSPYVVLPHAIFVCTTCAGVHRQFPGRVKGVSASTFSAEEVAMIEEGGNGAASHVLLAAWDPAQLPRPKPNDTQRIYLWIQAVFDQRKFVARPPQSAAPAPNGHLAASTSFTQRHAAASAPAPAAQPVVDLLGMSSPAPKAPSPGVGFAAFQQPTPAAQPAPQPVPQQPSWASFNTPQKPPAPQPNAGAAADGAWATFDTFVGPPAGPPPVQQSSAPGHAPAAHAHPAAHAPAPQSSRDPFAPAAQAGATTKDPFASAQGQYPAPQPMQPQPQGQSSRDPFAAQQQQQQQQQQAHGGQGQGALHGASATQAPGQQQQQQQGHHQEGPDSAEKAAKEKSRSALPEDLFAEPAAMGMGAPGPAFGMGAMGGAPPGMGGVPPGMGMPGMGMPGMGMQGGYGGAPGIGMSGPPGMPPGMMGRGGPGFGGPSAPGMGMQGMGMSPGMPMPMGPQPGMGFGAFGPTGVPGAYGMGPMPGQAPGGSPGMASGGFPQRCLSGAFGGPGGPFPGAHPAPGMAPGMQPGVGMSGGMSGGQPVSGPNGFGVSGAPGGWAGNPAPGPMGFGPGPMGAGVGMAHGAGAGYGAPQQGGGHAAVAAPQSSQPDMFGDLKPLPGRAPSALGSMGSAPPGMGGAQGQAQPSWSMGDHHMSGGYGGKGPGQALGGGGGGGGGNPFA